MTPLLAAVPAEGVLASHPIVSAIPFFVPTFIVVAVIGVVIWRDRRRGEEDPGREDAPDVGKRSDAA